MALTCKVSQHWSACIDVDENEIEKSHGLATMLATWPVEPVDGQWDMCVHVGRCGVPFWHALMSLRSAQWAKQVHRLNINGPLPGWPISGKAVSVLRSIFSGAEELYVLLIDLVGVVRMMPRVRKVVCY